jgi:signal transduction histidine kinase
LVRNNFGRVGREGSLWYIRSLMQVTEADSFSGNLRGRIDVAPSDHRRVLTPGRPAVLIVDDVEANLLALEALLEPLRCNVVRARSGQEALRHLLLGEFAVVLMDVLMPGLDGIATAELIKSRAATRYIPLIFLTGVEARLDEIAKGYAHGAVDYLVKPVHPQILRSKVAVFLELFQQRRLLQVQTELAQMREREALENRRLYESERGARAQAEGVARAREDIVAVVSHDLRNPMSAIAVSAGMLRRTLGTGKTDNLLPSIDAIERSVGRMENLVKDLLDTARIQSGNLAVELQAEDAVSMVHRIAEQLRPVVSTKAQRLDVVLADSLPAVRCDRERIFQVFSNLVGNATKFSAEGSTITITAEAQTQEILFTVVDEGSGISSEHLPHIFDPYWQASQERKRGLGLGLAIVKGIIEAHGTRIWVKSQPGIGSHFCFTLPIDETKVAPAPV